MGISTKIVKCVGVKYNLDGYNDKIRSESLEELFKIYKEVTGEDTLPDWCDDDILCALEEGVLDGRDVDLRCYGNSVADTRDNPFGIILTPNTPEAEELLKDILSKIGSTRRIGEHSEIYIC